MSGTLQDALGAAFGRPKVGPRSILGRPGLAKTAQETSKSEPGAVPRRLRTVLVRCPSACRASNTVERARGTIFWRFCVFAQWLLSTKNVAPAIVLYTSQANRTERTRAPRNHEKPRFSDPKTGPGNVRASQNRGPSRQIARPNAKNRRCSSIFLGK